MKINSIKTASSFIPILLFGILVCFVKPFTDIDLLISNDGSNYLAAAALLAQGQAPLIQLEQGGVGENVLFSSWPLGYPFLIAALSKCFGVDLVIASKLVNFLALIVCFGLLVRYCKFHHVPAFLIVCLPGFSEILSQTWSESVFIASLLLACVYWNKLLSCGRENINGFFVTFIFSIIISLPFLFRYIGLFLPFLIIILTFLSRFSRFQFARLIQAYVCVDGSRRLMIFSSTLSLGYVSLYLFMNAQISGYLTGRPRFFSPLQLEQELVNILIAFSSEILLFSTAYDVKRLFIGFICLVICVGFVWLFKDYYRVREFGNAVCKVFEFGSEQKLGYICLGVGFSYLGAIILAKIIFYFSDLSFRFLWPGSFLLLVSAVILARGRFRLLFVNYVTFSAVVGLLVYAVAKPIYLKNKYSEINNVQATVLIADDIPKNVVFISDHLRHLKYLRPDIVQLRPAPGESISEFFERSRGFSLPIWGIGLQDAEIRASYSDSVKRFYSSLPSNKAVLVDSMVIGDG